MKNVEKIFYSILLAITIFAGIFFFFPQKAEAAMVCGVAHPQHPEYCAFTYESNCCIVIRKPI